MTRTFVLIAVMSAVTALLRFLPFALFEKHAPRVVLYLGEVLPGAVMAMLVVYCFKNVQLAAAPHGLPELCAAVLVLGLHKWRHNTLLSVLGGTVCYMALLRIFG